MIRCARIASMLLLAPLALTGSAARLTAFPHAGAAWSLDKSRDAVIVDASSLSAIACAAATECTAVGYYVPNPGGYPNHDALAERWNGSAWKVEPSSEATTKLRNATWSDLAGVACPSRRACVAVGTFNNSTVNSVALGSEPSFSETWDGKTWTIRSTPDPANASDSYLRSVSCVSIDSCLAVGYVVIQNGLDQSTAPLVERFDGRRWTIVSTPASSVTDAELVSVSCTASRPFCLVIGVGGQSLNVPLAESWDTAGWTTAPTSSLGSYSLSGVSCAAARLCVGVGTGVVGRDELFAARWNGSTWTAQPTPLPKGYGGNANLNSVACESPHECIAVGWALNTRYYDQQTALAERWNGTKWKPWLLPSPARVRSSPAGVAYASARSALAVGSYQSAVTAPQILSDHWKGRYWAEGGASGPSTPAGATVVQGIGCDSSGPCMAVGYYTIGLNQGTQYPLAEERTASGWTLVPNPLPASDAGELSGVACPSAKRCIAVGARLGYGSETLAETWDGTSWSIMSTPAPRGGNGSQLNAVSCPSVSHCIAVGSSPTGALAEDWNGTSWSLMHTPAMPAGAAGVSAISCASTTSCMAVGTLEETAAYTTLSVPFALQWNGSSWSLQYPPTPGLDSHLLGVSCPTAGLCFAVGWYEDTSYSSSAASAVIDLWEASNWSTAPSAANPDGRDHGLTQVACTGAASCVAVIGGRSAISPSLVGLAWDGSAWTPVAAGLPKTTVGWLDGVACSSPALCTGVGWFDVSSSQIGSLAVAGQP